MKKKISVIGEYIGHLAMGATMFLALLLFGGSLNLIVHWVAPMIGDSKFLDLIQVAERVILYADVAFIIWWAVYSTYKAIKEMIDE